MPPATNATGSTGDHEVRRHFEKLPAILSGPNKRGTRMKCKWCGEEASENVTLYQRPHILGCNAYVIALAMKVWICYYLSILTRDRSKKPLATNIIIIALLIKRYI